jgi:hypothetical protein
VPFLNSTSARTRGMSSGAVIRRQRPWRDPCPRRPRSRLASSWPRDAGISAARRAHCVSCARCSVARARGGHPSASARQNPALRPLPARIGSFMPRLQQVAQQIPHDSADSRNPPGGR